MSKQTMAEQYREFLSGIDDDTITTFYPHNSWLLIPAIMELDDAFDPKGEMIDHSRCTFGAAFIGSGWNVVTKKITVMRDGSKCVVKYFPSILEKTTEKDYTICVYEKDE
jgi:hypothetical protein